MQGFVFIVVFSIVAWYYYHRFRESEIEYFKLKRKIAEVKSDNLHLKERIKDLELYKQDVSKTFKILDNELLGINEHIKHNSNQEPIVSIEDNNNNNNRTTEQPNQRISILTPEMLGQLFQSMQNENEHFTIGEEKDEIDGRKEDLASFSIQESNSFDKYLIDK